jgi:hypothetical protein
VGEMSGNTDTYWSTYMYKKMNDDKFYFGPVWDFDIAYENDYRTYPINNNSNWIFASSGSAATGVKEIVNRILTDPSFYIQLKTIYANYRNRGIITESKLLEVVNDYETQLSQSQKLNFMRWNILSTQVHTNPQALGTYVAEVNNVKNFIKNRLLWMDNKLAYKPTALNENSISKIQVYRTFNSIHIIGLSENANINILDLSGRLLLTKQLDYEFNITLKKGVYILKVDDLIEGQRIFKCIIAG